jgi:hypothetical protein
MLQYLRRIFCRKQTILRPKDFAPRDYNIPIDMDERLATLADEARWRCVSSGVGAPLPISKQEMRRLKART